MSAKRTIINNMPKAYLVWSLASEQIKTDFRGEVKQILTSGVVCCIMCVRKRFDIYLPLSAAER